MMLVRFTLKCKPNSQIMLVIFSLHRWEATK